MPGVPPTSGKQPSPGGGLGAGTPWIKPCEHQDVPDPLGQALGAQRGRREGGSRYQGPEAVHGRAVAVLPLPLLPVVLLDVAQVLLPGSPCGWPRAPARGSGGSGMAPGPRGHTVGWVHMDKTPWSRAQHVLGGLWGAGPTPGYSWAQRLFHPSQASSRAGSGAAQQGQQQPQGQGHGTRLGTARAGPGAGSRKNLDLRRGGGTEICTSSERGWRGNQGEEVSLHRPCLKPSLCPHTELGCLWFHQNPSVRILQDQFTSFLLASIDTHRAQPSPVPSSDTPLLLWGPWDF